MMRKSDYSTSNARLPGLYITGQDAFLCITKAKAAYRGKHQNLIIFNNEKRSSALHCNAKESKSVLKDKLPQVITAISIPIILFPCSRGVSIG